MIRRLRIASQIIFFAAFIFLLVRTQYNGTDELGLPVRILLEIDPLHFLSMLLAAGAIPGLLWLGLLTAGLALVFGRSFCGWVCPLGATIQLVQKLPGHGKRRLRETNRWRGSQRIKFYVLVGLLIVSLVGLQITGWVDPLSLVIRSMGLVVLPAFELGLRALFNAAYEHNPLGIARISEPAFQWLQGRALNFSQPHFHQAVLLGLIFFGILALSFVRYRFWCRVLCPLGALLGVLARFGFFRVEQRDGCSGCQACTFDCQGAADPEIAGGWRPSECVVCGNCTAACGRGVLAMGFARPRLRPAQFVREKQPVKDSAPALPSQSDAPSAAPDRRASAQPGAAFTGIAVSRRHMLIAGMAGLAAAPVLRLGESQVRANPDLIRPPGARPEKEFLKLCIRCGECMKVCLTNGLQPAFLEAGLEGMWTPRLVPRIGYCEYNCTLCGQVCPTHAIRRLVPEEKKKVRIGLAAIDPARCLPYAFQQTCIVCEEHCPLPRKAIWFQEVEVVCHDGSVRRVKQPRVDIALCTGCGICETKCVIQDRPAIRITSANEDRNPKNRVLLGNPGASSFGK